MRRLATALSAFACLGALAASGFLLAVPAYEGIATSAASAGGGVDTVRFTQTFAEANGPRAMGLLLLVTLVATAPLGVALARPAAQRATTWASALLLSAFSVLAGFTVGLFYLPSALTLLIAAVVTLAPERTTPDRAFPATPGD
jgi:hypothetical protein